MRKNITLLTVLLVTHGCLNTHQRLGVLDEENNISAASRTVWFESFVEAVDHAENFKEVQKVIGQGKAYLACRVEWEDDEYTPLHYAAEQGNLEAVKELIEKHGIPINIKTGLCQRTPLHLAALAGQLHVAKTLLQKSEHVRDDVDHQGNNALFYAASGIQGESNTEVVKWLIGQGADPKVTIDEISLLDCTVNANNRTLVQFLFSNCSFNKKVLERSLSIAKGLHRRDIVHVLEQ